MNAARWLSVKQVSARWGISRMSVYRFIDDGHLTAHKFGRLYRILLADVVEYEKNNVFVPNLDNARGPEEETG